MKVALFALALVALAAPIFASRELLQLGVDFAVCPAVVRKNCCDNFKFGNITQLHDGKAWPEKTKCKYSVEEEVPVGIRPLDKPLKHKEDIHEYVDTKIEKESVNLVTTFTWKLVKYEPPNNLWSNSKGKFCVCPSPGAIPPTPAPRAAAAAATTVVVAEKTPEVPPEIAAQIPPEGVAAGVAAATGEVGPGAP